METAASCALSDFQESEELRRKKTWTRTENYKQGETEGETISWVLRVKSTEAHKIALRQYPTKITKEEQPISFRERQCSSFIHNLETMTTEVGCDAQTMEGMTVKRKFITCKDVAKQFLHVAKNENHSGSS